MEKCRLLLLFLTSLGQSNANFKIVQTSSGPVKGYKSPLGDFVTFLGIPYATLPTGDDKFKAPLPAPNWTEPFEAVQTNIFCPQGALPPHIKTEVTIKEECLIANVYVPNTSDQALPVLVYIHGGAYQGGNGGTLTPHALISEGNFIVVNFNYRVGVHGFLCLGTKDAPGNAGMKDQVALLRWVQKNIANFGGDPDDVTIDGYSAGSSAVELLLLSETTKGLFRKIIPESGAGVGVWSTQSDPVDLAKTMARKLGFELDDVYALEKFYKTTPLEKLNANDCMGYKDSTFSFVPCVERDVGQEMFLREAPDDIMKRGDFPKLPTLVGFADMEGLIRAPQFDQWKDDMNEKFSDFLPADLAFKDDEEREEVAKKIKKFYFGDKPVSEETAQSYVDYFGDIMFGYPAMKSVRYQVEAGNEDVYLYVFAYYDNVTLSMRKLPQVKGADHATQTLTVLEFLDSLKLTANYNKMQAVMRKLWISFVKTGTPVSQPNGEYPGGWPATSADGTPYMELTLPPRLKGYLIQDRARFWEGVYAKYYRKPVAPSAPSLAVKRSEL